MTATAAFGLAAALLLIAAGIQFWSLRGWRREEIPTRDFLERQRVALVVAAAGVGIGATIAIVDWAAAMACTLWQ